MIKCDFVLEALFYKARSVLLVGLFYHGPAMILPENVS